MSGAREAQRPGKRPGRPRGPKAPPRRGRKDGDDWKRSRPRAELVRAWLAGAVVVVLSATAVVVLGRDKIWTDEPPAPPASTPAPTAPLPTAPFETPPTPGDTPPEPGEPTPPGEIPGPEIPTVPSNPPPDAPAP